MENYSKLDGEELLSNYTPTEPNSSRLNPYP